MVGATLAAIGGFKFEKPGRLEVEEHAAALTVGEKFIEGPDQIARLMDTFLASANCERCAGPKLRDCMTTHGLGHHESRTWKRRLVSFTMISATEIFWFVRRTASV